MLKKLGWIIITLFILSFFIIPTQGAVILKIYDPYNPELLYDVYYVNGTFIQEYWGNATIALDANNSYIFIPEKNIIDLSDPTSLNRYASYFMTLLLLILFIFIPIMMYRRGKK